MIWTRPRLALVGALSLLALSGCGGGSESGSAGSLNAAAGGDVAAPAPAARAPAAQGAGGSTVDHGAFSATDVQPNAIIRTGDISIRTTDPQRARDRVDVFLTRLHGLVDDEHSVYDKHGRIRETHLVLRVPVASFSTAMTDLEQLGTVASSSSTGRDVTTEVIDVQQRLETLQISLHDLNSFQRHAATIGQLLRFENAITERRGEYQSLKAQRDHLLSQTTMSTIDLDLSVPPSEAVATGHRSAGFVTGLRHGWTALTGTVTVALTALGAVLPFAVLLALVGLPLWWWIRRGGITREAADEVSETPGSSG
jgi:Domain of unknown function (DUF4349)